MIMMSRLKSNDWLFCIQQAMQAGQDESAAGGEEDFSQHFGGWLKNSLTFFEIRFGERSRCRLTIG
jgi:hypothetical protein